MKNIVSIFSVCALLITINTYAQHITNTLGAGGLFKVKDIANDYLTLSQSTGQVNILNTLRLENTTDSNTGIIYKGTENFLHTYQAAGTEGYNTFLGLNSGNFTMGGTLYEASYNTAVGKSALSSLTTGSNNSAFGLSSLLYNTTGYDNSAFGVNSLSSNSTGYDNSAFGFWSLVYNTTGYNNSAFGINSLYSNVTGYDNSAFGANSLLNNLTGSGNSAFGFESLKNNTLGSGNSAFGYWALSFNTTGIDNCAFGDGAGSNITTGNFNIAIGYNAIVPSGTASNQVRIGNHLVTYAGVQVAWTITSDKRSKDNIRPSDLGLSFISKLNPVSYTRINDKNQKTEYGLIAQELEEVLNQAGVDNPGMLTITDQGIYELRYNDLISPVIKAIQELNEKNERL